MPKKKEQKKSDSRKRLVLLDAHAIIHRAYHALPEFTSSKGEPTGALYGLTAMLLKLIEDLKPDFLVACYDLPDPTYRHEVYDGYKAKRKETDDALVAQLERSRDIFKVFNIPIYEKAGFEADDMLGTIVEEVRSMDDIEVVIASGDMDTLQLVEGKRVQVYTLKKGIQDTILYDEKAVIDRFGFPPKLLPDYKGLRGDPSDNIIGIPGIGEKTASELIAAFGTIEEMYVALKKGVKPFEKAGIKPRIIELLKTHEEEAVFSKMLASIRRDAPIAFRMPKMWRDGIEINTILTLFTELNFRTLSARVKAMFGSGDAEDAPEEKTPVESFDPMSAKRVQIAAWLLDPERTNPTLEDALAFAKTKTVPEAEKSLLKSLQEEKLLSIFEDIELPLLPVIEHMEKRGVMIDKKYLKKLSEEYHKELTELESTIHKAAGFPFNINSPKQLGDVLFDTLGLSVKNQKKTSTGQRSTRESELEKMRELHPVIDSILEYRELQKLLGTYIDTIPTLLDKEERLHTTFIQTGAATGRMASKDPGIQNIPIRTERGRKIRNAFLASPGYTLLAFDYSQIELRVAAFLSGDKKLISIFKEGGDVHTAVAREVFGVEASAVDKEMRRRAKVINFGILYGMGVNALKTNLGTSREEAQKFYNDYFEKFSGLAEYLEKVKRDARKYGYTETAFGRKRYFPGLKSSLPYIVAQAERMAINAPIQGTEADLIKIAMIRAHAYREEHRLQDDLYLLLQVHDELVFEVRHEHLSDVVPPIKKIMEGILTSEMTKQVPIIVEASAGPNWGELSKI